MIVRGNEPNIRSYNLLMHEYVLEGHLNDAAKVVNSMVQEGLELNVHSYGILISACCKNGRMNEAMSLFNEMIGEGVTPNVVLYSTYYLRQILQDWATFRRSYTLQ